MKKIGIFYGEETVKTASIAKKIQELFGESETKMVPVEEAWEKEFEAYDNLIVGSATWFDGELPNYWDITIPELKSLNLKGKKIAIFGLGDQVNYSENFVDSIGLLAKAFLAAGAIIVGQTSPEGYSFSQSLALKDEKLLGLAIDEDNQHEKTNERVSNWVTQLKKEFQ